MVKKTITYEDFNGNSVSEELAFHLSQAELAEMEASVPGGLGESLKKEVDADDYLNALKFLRMFILNAYGVIDADGRHFRKTDETGKKYSIDFECSLAFETLYEYLSNNPDEATAFLKAIAPKSVSEKMQNNA